jgi:hypothetical protein
MRRRLTIGLVFVAAALAAAHWLPLPWSVSDPAPATAGQPEKAVQESKSDERFAALPERAPLAAPRGALFSAPPPPPKPKPAAPVAQPKPVAPPVPYRVAGRVAHDGTSKLVLMKGDRVITVQEGDVLEGGYRVDSIRADEITLVYEPLGTRERLSLVAAASAPTPTAPAAAGGTVRPAQLRWDGPQRVKAGTVFDVALKVTSDEPLRSAPLRVSYDAQLLEPVAVRAGKFFADASFSYRIDPSGSIIVAASGAGAAAADAELVILSFRPVRPAPAAEVRLAALQLQRGAGAPLPSEPLGAFRTAITQ